MIRGSEVLKKCSWEPREESVLHLGDVKASVEVFPELVTSVQAVEACGRFGAELSGCLCSPDIRTCSSF